MSKSSYLKKVLVLEKDWCEQEVLCRIINEVTQDILLFRCNTPEDAERTLEETEIDLFLVSAGEKSGEKGLVPGLCFVKRLRKRKEYLYVPVIFFSGQTKYELYAYRYLHCYQYVYTPFDREEVRQLISEILCIRRTSSEEPFIVFSFRGIIHRFPVKEIIYIESIERKLFVTTIYETVVLPGMILKEFADTMDHNFFIQCHRSFIVNLHYIRRYDKRNDTLHLVNTKKEIPVGKTFRVAVTGRLRAE